MIYTVKVELDVDCGEKGLVRFEDIFNIIYKSKPTYDDFVVRCVDSFFKDIECDSEDYEKFELVGSRVTILNALKDNIFSKAIEIEDNA